MAFYLVNPVGVLFLSQRSFETGVDVVEVSGLGSTVSPSRRVTFGLEPGTPQTLNPKPWTLNRKPSTLNPQPETVDPEP